MRTLILATVAMTLALSATAPAFAAKKDCTCDPKLQQKIDKDMKNKFSPLYKCMFYLGKRTDRTLGSCLAQIDFK